MVNKSLSKEDLQDLPQADLERNKNIRIMHL